MNYEFLKNAKIWVQSGKLYLFKASLEQKQVNLDDFYGMPVLPETKVEITNDKSYASFSYYDGSSMRLDGPGIYYYYPLGTKAEQYAVSLSAPNDWYYSKLSSFQNDINSTNSSYGIKKGDTVYDLSIGSFDTLFTKKITLFTKDGNGNLSSKDLTLTIYPPVPNIESITGSIISGRLDETLGNEPVDIFRLRNGAITRIESAKSNS